ncbi:MAG: DUF192 domain-containing protein [Dethiobacteria bacterium]|jgi:uncharacterized membrane protein (UPF0127 family)
MMKKVRVVNLSQETVILQEAAVANTFLQRFKGLLGRKCLPPGQGLIIEPCQAVHTCGMAFSLDVAFVDRENRICYLLEGMAPYRLSPVIKKAGYVIEATAGTFRQTQTRCGDTVKLEELTD